MKKDKVEDPVEAPSEEPKTEAKEPVTLAEYEEALTAENAKLEQLKAAGRMLNQELTNTVLKIRTFQAVIKALQDNGK